jgi:hypothetical protein
MRNEKNRQQQTDIRKQMGQERDPNRRNQLQQRLGSLERSEKVGKLAQALRNEREPQRQAALHSQFQKLARSSDSRAPSQPSIGRSQRSTPATGPFTTSFSGRIPPRHNPTLPVTHRGRSLQPIGPATKPPAQLASTIPPAIGARQRGNARLQPTGNSGSSRSGSSDTQSLTRTRLPPPNKPTQTLTSTRSIPQAGSRHPSSKPPAVASVKPPASTGTSSRVESVRTTTSSSGRRSSTAEHRETRRSAAAQTSGSRTTRAREDSNSRERTAQRNEIVRNTPRPSPTTTVRMVPGGGTGGLSMPGGGRRR